MGEQLLTSMLRDTGSRRAAQATAADRLAALVTHQLAGREHIRTVADGGVRGDEAADDEDRVLARGREARHLPEAGFKQGGATHLPGLHAGGRHAGDGAARGHVHAPEPIGVENVEGVRREIDDVH